MTERFQLNNVGIDAVAYRHIKMTKQKLDIWYERAREERGQLPGPAPGRVLP